MHMPPYHLPYYPRSPPQRKRRYSEDDSSDERNTSDDSATGPDPLIAEWLNGLVLDPIRGCDNINYASFTDRLTDNGILRLGDLTHFKASDLVGLAGMNIGTAARIINWAKQDKGRFKRNTGGRKARKTDGW
jgi:hypothetical protein